MGVIDVRKILRVPGRLAFGISTPSDDWPHGGTGLGSTRGITLKHFGADFPVTAEEFGGEPVEVLQRAEAWGLACVLRTFDNDAVNTVFPNTSVGATTQHRKIVIPGTRKAGRRRSDNAVVLAFTPDNERDAPMILLYNAVPMLEETAALNFNREEDVGIPVVFMGIRNSAGLIMEVGRKHDLTVPP